MKVFLPLEAMDLAIPDGLFSNLLSGEKTKYTDTLNEDYGEYLEEKD